MLNEELKLMELDDIDVSLYMREIEDKDLSNVFQDSKFSSFVSNNDCTDILALLNEHEKTSENDDHFDTPSKAVVPTDNIGSTLDVDLENNYLINDQQIDENNLNQNLNYNLYEETIVSQNTCQTSEKMGSEINTNPFESIPDDMYVKQQPKADQRVRYASDSIRFLPDAKKHPMSIKLPDLSSKSLEENQLYGIRLTMVTSELNEKNKTFIHVNGIKYRTNEVTEFDDGSIFIPITKSDIINGEKSFPRLSIICKKFDEYTFDLTIFDPTALEKNTEKYTLINEDVISKAAKGKQFTIDYDLLCYKIIFQLAFKQDNIFMISTIQCETNIINEQKTPTKGIKRKDSSNENTPKNKKDSIDLPIYNPPKKFKPSTSSLIDQPVKRTSNRNVKRFIGVSVGSS